MTSLNSRTLPSAPSQGAAPVHLNKNQSPQKQSLQWHTTDSAGTSSQLDDTVITQDLQELQALAIAASQLLETHQRLRRARIACRYFPFVGAGVAAVLMQPILGGWIAIAVALLIVFPLIRWVTYPIRVGMQRSQLQELKQKKQLFDKTLA
jgi:hypothetical protein